MRPREKQSTGYLSQYAFAIIFIHLPLTEDKNRLIGLGYIGSVILYFILCCGDSIMINAKLVYTKTFGDFKFVSISPLLLLFFIFLNIIKYIYRYIYFFLNQNIKIFSSKQPFCIIEFQKNIIIKMSSYNNKFSFIFNDFLNDLILDQNNEKQLYFHKLYIKSLLLNENTLKINFKVTVSLKYKSTKLLFKFC